jgi:hypothetical protein
MNEVLKFKKKELSSFDNSMMNILTGESAKERAKDNDLFCPVIFDYRNPEEPIETPLLSNLNNDMMFDSNIEVLNSNKSIVSNINDAMDARINYNLAADQMYIAQKTIENNIIESSVMSFANYWTFVKSNILCNILSINDEFDLGEDSCACIFYKKIENNFELHSMILQFLQIFSEVSSSLINTDPRNPGIDEINAQYIYDFAQRKAINISQYITAIIIESIREGLFRYLSKYRLEIMAKDSKLIQQYINSNFDPRVMVQQLIEYSLYDSLYNFTQNCLNPSINNILTSTIHSSFTMYSDAYDIFKIN